MGGCILSSFLHTGDDLFEFEILLHVLFLLIHFLVVILVLGFAFVHLLFKRHCVNVSRSLHQLLRSPKALHRENFALRIRSSRSHVWVESNHLGFVTNSVVVDDRLVLVSHRFQIGLILFLFSLLGWFVGS